MKSLKNSKGNVYYGMHFYPGVAEYQEPGGEPYRVFVQNTKSIVKSCAMDPTFAGRPIFVEHVDEVTPDRDELRKEADGWVVESFYNVADGKHWVKFIVVSELGDRAIKAGMRLSNAYVPNKFSNGGLWNGVSYAKEITGGEYEHLAIVKNPRYEESVIMSPEEFKQYNEQKKLELIKLANSKEKGETGMKLNFFKRSKVENSIDPELMVELPKSKKEVSIAQLVNDADEASMPEAMANMEHKVKLHDGSMVNVGDLVAKHKAMCDEMEAMKGKKEDEVESESDLEVKKESVEVEGSKENDDKDGDDDAKKKELAKNEDEELEAAKKKNELDAATKAAAKEKADKLRKAHLNALNEAPGQTIETSGDRVKRGKELYGSG